jgi:eukaryotic-like serine/threonine-protein kinase
MFLKPDSFKDFFLHAVIAVSLFFGGVLLFFYWYLPNVTNHGQAIEVPDLAGKSFEEGVAVLEKANLRYEISDSSYFADKKPLEVLSQYPKAGATVKENRRIYLIINAITPPSVKMPKLIDGSVKNAQLILEGYGLKLGKIDSVPDIAQNAVLKQLYNRKEIEVGTKIPKGSVIDLVVGMGLGNVEINIPLVSGLKIDEGSKMIVESGFQIGNVIYDEASTEPEGTILKQRPEYEPGKKIRGGQLIDIWVSGTEPEYLKSGVNEDAIKE